MDVIKFHLNQLSKSVTGAITRFGSFPDEVMCANDKCGAMIPVPHTVFRWVCMNAHENDPTDQQCSQCTSTKKEVVAAGRYTPTITCPCCSTLTAVPDSNLSASFGATVRRAPQAFAATITRAINDLSDLGQSPESFPCQHCTATLLPPKGAWTCQKDNCGQENADGTAACSKCKASRYATGVVCGVCNRNTYVPSVKATAGVANVINSANRSVDISAQYISGKPFVTCHHCANVIDLPSESAIVDVKCPKCQKVDTYAAAEVSKKNVEELFSVPAAQGEEKEASGPCGLCSALAGRVCQCCGKGFCDVHAPYIRKIPSKPLGTRLPVCKNCIGEYDRTYMAGGAPIAAAPATAPAAASVAAAAAPVAAPAAAVAAPVAEKPVEEPVAVPVEEASAPVVTEATAAPAAEAVEDAPAAVEDVKLEEQ